MNYTVCLDPYSLNFTPSELSGNGFAIYTDADNFTSPIAVNIPASSIFSPPSGNCSVTLTNIPNGATQILVIDQCDGLPPSTPGAPDAPSYTCCYALINLPEGCVPWCEECGIGFDTFQTSSIGTIVAGNLTSSCGTVTDYTIGWYLDGDYSAPAFTTGFGSAVGPYQFQHPLTGSGAIPALAGDWEGIIHDVIINGITYSSISGSANGTLIPFESCFGTVVIDPLTCDNGTASGKYSHQYNFNSQAVGTTPAPVSLTYTLDSTIKYFAYAFRALFVWDEIEIKWFSGDPNATSNPSLYSQPIYLEKLQAGNDTQFTGQYNPTNPLTNYGYIDGLPNFPINYAPGTNTLSSTTPPTVNNVWPKKTSNSSYFQRVLTLTNLETSSNPAAPDFLEITITPNPSNNNTQWQAGFQCLTDFDCTNCFLDDYPDSLPSIWKIELDKQYGCDKQRIRLHISGCKPYETSDWAGVSLNNNLSNPSINLIGSGIRLGGSGFVDVPWVGFGSWFNLSGNTSCTAGQTPANLTCSPPSTNIITLDKTPNQIQLTFNSESDYLHYKNNIINVFNSMGVSSPVSCNYNMLGTLPYYQYFQLYVPFQAPTVNCGDNSTTLQYNFSVNDYFNIQYVENASSNLWSITIPQTPMVNCYPNNSSQCDSCFNTISGFINTYNNNLFSTFSFTTNVGAKFVEPVSKRWISRNSSGGASGSYCNLSVPFYQSISYYSINTIPFISSSQSTTGWVNLPSLGASLTCSLLPYPYATNNMGYGGEYYGRFNTYQVRFPSLTSSFDYSLSTNDFEVYILSNFGPTGSINETPNVWPLPCPDPEGALIYSYTGGVATVYTSSHFWQGNNPTLIIDP